MSEESRVDTKTVERLNQRIHDLRCAVQLLILLIISITVVLIAQALDSPYASNHGWYFYYILFTVMFVPAIIFILRAHGDQEKTESFKHT